MALKLAFTAIRKNARLYRTDKLASNMDRYSATFVLLLEKSVKTYPAEYPQPQRYKRTFRLRNAWRTRRTSSGGNIQWTLSNAVQDRRSNVYYAARVHGTGTPNDQSQMQKHKDWGWKNLYEELERMGGRGKFAKGAQAIITRELA